MPSGVTVAEVFAAAGLRPYGPSPWGRAIDETRPGVYVLSVASDPNTCFGLFDVPGLPPEMAHRWLADEPVIYIGRTRRPLRLRVGQFYRHKYGKKSPHRGGQAVLLLEPKPLVFWAPTEDAAGAERDMIEAFLRRTGRLPFANRRRGTRHGTAPDHAAFAPFAAISASAETNPRTPLNRVSG